MLSLVTVTRDLKAILAVGAICASAALTGCGIAVQVEPPKSSPTPISVSLSPTTASMEVEQSQRFTAAIQNDAKDSGVTWSLTQLGKSCDSSCGSLSTMTETTVNYTAPVSAPNPATVTLTATSVSDGSKSATSAITITGTADDFVTVVKFCADETENPNCSPKDTFSLAKIRDSIIWVNWQGVPKGTHTQQINIFMPQGNSPYATYSDGFQVTDASKGAATIMRPMPIAGTWITQRQLIGAWKVDVLLDGQLITSKQLTFAP
jgi:hypothetical protein